MTRNAYLLSGLLHVAALALMFLVAQMPAKQIPPLRRFQPVRLVAPSGPPGPAIQVKGEPVKPGTPVQVKPQPVEKVKSTSKAATKETPGGKGKETAAKKATPTPAVTGGGGGGSVNLDGANFPYPYYLSNIQIKILSNFKPSISAKQAKALKAVVFFVVDKNGRISEVKLENKSGHFLFDQEAQRAILRSSPLPALPPAFGSDRLGVHFEFVGAQ
jgi:TonB family protein